MATIVNSRRGPIIMHHKGCLNLYLEPFQVILRCFILNNECTHNKQEKQNHHPNLSKRNVHVIGENYEMVVGFFRFFACSKFLIFFSLVLFYFGEKILGWTWLIRQSGTWQGRMRWSQVGGKNFLVGWACPFFNTYPCLQ